MNTIKDGWTTLRFLMVTCPKWLFFFQSILFLLMSALSLYEIFTNQISTSSIALFEKTTSMIFYFLISFQIFMFGLFSSLTAVKLKMLKSKNLKKFFNIFKIRYAFIISCAIIVVIFADNYFYQIFFVQEYIKKIIYYFGIFFAILLFINSLFVSLITIDQQE